MTGQDCAVMCNNSINIHTRLHLHTMWGEQIRVQYLGMVSTTGDRVALHGCVA